MIVAVAARTAKGKRRMQCGTRYLPAHPGRPVVPAESFANGTDFMTLGHVHS